MLTATVNGKPIEQQSWGPRFDGSIRQFGQQDQTERNWKLPMPIMRYGRRKLFCYWSHTPTRYLYSHGDFYLSAQNVSIDGTLEGDKNERRTVNLKAEREYGRFKAGFALLYTQSQYDVTNNQIRTYYNVTVHRATMT
jgi:hypothetical protein